MPPVNFFFLHYSLACQGVWVGLPPPPPSLKKYATCPLKPRIYKR